MLNACHLYAFMLNTRHSYAFIGVADASTAGVAMSNIASTLGKVGRRKDALELFEKAMEFRIHVLPEEHPEIGEFDSQLLCSVIVIMTSLGLQGMPCTTSLSHSASFIGTRML